MPGFSLSLLLLPRSQAGVEILRALDAPASALGWNYNGASEPGHIVESSTEESSDEIVDPLPACLRQSFSFWFFLLGSMTLNPACFGLAASDRTRFIAAITSACRALIEAEPEITRQDVIAGDGDAGLTLLAGAQGKL
jgi:dihydroxyacetone kinase